MACLKKRYHNIPCSELTEAPTDDVEIKVKFEDEI